MILKCFVNRNNKSKMNKIAEETLNSLLKHCQPLTNN